MLDVRKRGNLGQGKNRIGFYLEEYRQVGERCLIQKVRLQ